MNATRRLRKIAGSALWVDRRNQGERSVPNRLLVPIEARVAFIGDEAATQPLPSWYKCGFGSVAPWSVLGPVWSLFLVRRGAHGRRAGLTRTRGPLSMITRYALFEGQVHAGKIEAFRAAVLGEVLPHWKSFPGALAVRVCFSNERDDGAPELPLILAITYPNRAAVDVALASPERALAKAATESVLARYFKGRVHHHITEANDHALGA